VSLSRPIWLDIARLVERACVGSLTGIDRVELAYAENLAAMTPDRIRFVMLGRWSSRLSMLPEAAATTFLKDIRQAWSEGCQDACRGLALRLLARAAIAPSPPADPTAIYLLVSHRHLNRKAALRQVLRRSRAIFVPFIHDLIPLEFPEYGRPGEATRHRQRIEAVAQFADGIIVNSAATREALAPHVPADTSIYVAPLGASQPASTGNIAPVGGDRPYFLSVGTIEPRKNHLLLLHLWRRLITEHGDDSPRLLIAGRRGWENENVLDLLDRCPALRGHVVELGAVPDARLGVLLRGARALLMPSFAEGFGLPVAEALSHGTPVLCSDLPALHEVGGNVPEYLDPLDSPAWQRAVLDYAAEMSPRRNAQLDRLSGWRGTSWDAHVGSIIEFVDSLAVTPIQHHVPLSYRLATPSREASASAAKI
jgi:glycosyltransferase involved in cell wall biosynthesis